MQLFTHSQSANTACLRTQLSKIMVTDTQPGGVNSVSYLFWGKNAQNDKTPLDIPSKQVESQVQNDAVNAKKN